MIVVWRGGGQNGDPGCWPTEYPCAIREQLLRVPCRLGRPRKRKTAAAPHRPSEPGRDDEQHWGGKCISRARLSAADALLRSAEELFLHHSIWRPPLPHISTGGEVPLRCLRERKGSSLAVQPRESPPRVCALLQDELDQCRSSFYFSRVCFLRRNGKRYRQLGWHRPSSRGAN